jgi:hypothetical protein|tara:strand:+ start:52 stop:249 length:198 start_codon:yes stop_codon:yes gene_type:complete
MAKWYLYEVMMTGVMDVLMVALFGVVFYFLMKWYVWIWFKRIWLLLLAINKKLDMLFEEDDHVSD